MLREKKMAEHRCNKSKKKGKIRLTKMADGAIGVVVVCFLHSPLEAIGVIEMCVCGCTQQVDIAYYRDNCSMGANSSPAIVRQTEGIID